MIIMDFLTGSDIVQQLDEPMTKQPKLSRFDQDQLTSSPSLAKSSMGPPNTRYNTQLTMGLNTFNSWIEWRNKSKPNDPIPSDIMTCDAP